MRRMEHYKILTLQILLSLLEELTEVSPESILNEGAFGNFLFERFRKEEEEEGERRFRDLVYSRLWDTFKFKHNLNILWQELGDAEERIRKRIEERLSEDCLICNILNDQSILEKIFNEYQNVLEDLLFKYEYKDAFYNQRSVFEIFLLRIFKDKLGKIRDLIHYLNSYKFKVLSYYIRLLLRIFFFKEIFLRSLSQAVSSNFQEKKVFTFRLYAKWLEDIIRDLDNLTTEDKREILLIIMRNIEHELPSRLIEIIRKYCLGIPDEYCIEAMYCILKRKLRANEERENLLEILKKILFDVTRAKDINKLKGGKMHEKVLERIKNDLDWLLKELRNKRLRELLADLLSEILIIIIRILREINEIKSDIRFSDLVEKMLKELIQNAHVLELLLTYLLEMRGAVTFYNTYIIPFIVKYEDEIDNFSVSRDKNLENKLGEIDLIWYIPAKASLKMVELTTTSKKSRVKGKFGKFNELIKIMKSLNEYESLTRLLFAEFSTILRCINFKEDQKSITGIISEEGYILDSSENKVREKKLIQQIRFSLTKELISS